jgi:hypothetical protein
MFCAIALAFVVGLPTSIYEREPAPGAAQATAASIIAVSALGHTPSDKAPLDLQGEKATNLAAVAPDEKPLTSPIEIEAKPIGSDDTKPSASVIAPSIRNDDVDLYLWNVYQRTSLKIDSLGDFTWKDAAAAARVGLSTKEYVIGGMDPDFRELLSAAGQALDAAGIDWTILSAFRDDYRQSVAVGLKARSDNSFHGGSAATGGYGHGCAVDVASTDRLSDNMVWNWLDQHGEQFGLHRPLHAIDPAHVQPRPGWRELASMLRSHRIAIRAEAALADNAGSDLLEPTPPASTDNSSFAGLSAEQYFCVRPQVVGEPNQPNPKVASVHRLNSLFAHRSASAVERNSPKAKWRIGGRTPIHGEARAPASHSHGKTAAPRHLAELESPATWQKHAPSSRVPATAAEE